MPPLYNSKLNSHNKSISVQDNFLTQEEFDQLEVNIRDDIRWQIGGVDNPKEYPNVSPSDNFQLHCDLLTSPYFKIVFPIVDKLDIRSWVRIKSNMRPRTFTTVHTHFHTDFPSPKYDGLTTSIFYANTCNGYTEFEDGTKIESVANRLALFSGKLSHRGVRQTDTKSRCVINFNWFRADLGDAI